MNTNPLESNIISYIYPQGENFFQENEMKMIWEYLYKPKKDSSI